MNREQLQAALAPFGFTWKIWEFSDQMTLEHPLCDSFYMSHNVGQSLPTLAEIMENFYRSARSDESSDHRCW